MTLRLALALALAILGALAREASASSPIESASPLARQQSDRILLISTRPVGIRCDALALAERMHCEELVAGPQGAVWTSEPWSTFLTQFAGPMPTVIYVHGNRVDSGEDKSHGMTLYRSLAAHKPTDQPIRYIIWSWPSEQIRGPLKDYQVKAARTRPVGWQLAWAIDQLPAETPLALVGYSYGARVVTGALHLLAGGQIDDLRLPARQHAQRAPIRAALVAAAEDADWLRPGGYHGRALEQVDQLLLVNNTLDPAMRFYRVPMEGRAVALGYSGPRMNGASQALASRVRLIDATQAVGRHHALVEYLASSGPVERALELVVKLPPISPLGAAAPLPTSSDSPDQRL